MQQHFSLKRRVYYPWLFLGLVLGANGLLFAFFPNTPTVELLLTVTGSVAALVHFLYSQHNNNTERFIELYREFNGRFDRLNDRLNILYEENHDQQLSNDDKHLLYDYFNLCAEEYFYFRAGYIDSEVWMSWLRGMRHFLSKPEIRALWQNELESGSYYGFKLEIIDKAP